MWVRAISLKQILSHRLLKICRILFVCLSRWYDAANQEKWFPTLWMTLHLCDCSTELGGWRFKNSSAYSDAADDCRRILPCGEDGTSSDSFPSPTANRKQGEKNYGDHLQFVFSILGFLNPFWGIPYFLEGMEVPTSLIPLLFARVMPILHFYNLGSLWEWAGCIPSDVLIWSGFNGC